MSVHCGQIEQRVSTPLRGRLCRNDIRDLYWLVNNIKPQASDDKKFAVWADFTNTTANNIEYRPTLTMMFGWLKSKFKWRRHDIGTKATMATALTVKNFLRASRKKDVFARLCLNKRVTDTYLQSASLRLLVSCQKIIFRRFKPGFYRRKTNSIVSQLCPLCMYT